MKKSVWALLLGCVLLSFGGCKPMEKALEGKEGVFAVMETSKGKIVLELYYKDTPLTVTNFVGLAEGTLDAAKGKPFYDGLKFHRVISKANGDEQDFMIQGGDPRGNGTGGPGYKFPDEFVDKYTFNKPGILAMANSGANTNGSQFFITIVPTTWLDGKHTIFGNVIEGQNIVNTMKTGDLIKSVKIYRQGKDAEKFSATQADFDKLVIDAGKKSQEANAKKLAAKIAEVEKAFPGYEKDNNGIYYKITKQGSGSKCGKGKNVSTEYKGYFVNGEVFDQSKGRGPLDFTTGIGQMIPGFDIMVQDMKVGEKRTVVLPPDQAYGENGIPGAIPGNSYLAFDIELVSVK
jgi:cyclophilin family peptidyl-prolyl cis-trans isomerase